MKKNIMLVLLTIVLAPATFEVAAVVRETASNTVNAAGRTVDNTAGRVLPNSSCGPRCKRTTKCPTCKVAKPCCPKKVKVCKKACPFVSKCPSCEERAAARADRENRADMEEEEGSMLDLPRFRTE